MIFFGGFCDDCNERIFFLEEIYEKGGWRLKVDGAWLHDVLINTLFVSTLGPKSHSGVLCKSPRQRWVVLSSTT